MMQPGSRPIALFAVLLVCFFALIAGCMAVSGGVTVSSEHHHETPRPYRQTYFAQLRYDARQICADTIVADNTETARAWADWHSAVNAYLSDQRALEQARHITTPNYQDMANVVCPQ